MQKFLSELQRRKVLRVATGYVVASWVILQVALSLQAAIDGQGVALARSSLVGLDLEAGRLDGLVEALYADAGLRPPALAPGPG